MPKNKHWLICSSTRGILLDYYNAPIGGEACYVWSNLPPIRKVTPGHVGPLPHIVSAIVFWRKEDAQRLTTDRRLDDDGATITFRQVRVESETSRYASIEACAALGYGWRSENAPAFRNWPIPSERSSKNPIGGDMRVWHIPQVPGKPFYVHGIESDLEAIGVISLLAKYDLFQYENKIKPDYANASGLQIYEDGEWIEWNNDDGENIDDVMRRES